MMKLILPIALLLTGMGLAMPAKAENPEHTRQLLSTKKCQRCDLTGAGLVFANLANVDLRGSDLSGANLSRANLTNANLSGAKLVGTSLNGANLSGANLSGADLSGTDFTQAYLNNADLRNANMVYASLKGAIGTPIYALNAADLYRWGLEEAKRGNHSGAVNYYNQTLALEPKSPTIYLSRAISLFKLGDNEAAIRDSEVASKLYSMSGDTKGYETSQQVIKVAKQSQAAVNAPPNAGGGDFGSALMGVFSTLLNVFF